MHLTHFVFHVYSYRASHTRTGIKEFKIRTIYGTLHFALMAGFMLKSMQGNHKTDQNMNKLTKTMKLTQDKVISSHFGYGINIFHVKYTAF